MQATPHAGGARHVHRPALEVQQLGCIDANGAPEAA